MVFPTESSSFWSVPLLLSSVLSLSFAFWILMGFLEISIFLSCGGPKLYGNVVWKQTIWNGFLIIGTKDLPVIARTAGRLAGRAIGYVQLARGQFDNVMHKSQASQVLKFFSLLLLFIYLLIEHMVIGVKCV